MPSTPSRGARSRIGPVLQLSASNILISLQKNGCHGVQIYATNELDYIVWGSMNTKKRQEILGIIISQQWNAYIEIKKPHKKCN
jgi:hypothetical protein